jgi:DNA-binding GntR family transcriptional regulator
MQELSGEGASQSVYRGILMSLESGIVVPGQRLIESELAVQFGVGRNAVREAMQRLAACGVVNLHRNRSASIRQIDVEEADEIFDVAGVVTELLVAAATTNFDLARHGGELEAALAELKAAYADGKEFVFSHARRSLYRVLLKIANNRELLRIFPVIGTHIINAKFKSRTLQTIRMRYYQKLVAMIFEGDAKRAGALARRHNEQMRLAMRELAALQSRSRSNALASEPDSKDSIS